MSDPLVISQDLTVLSQVQSSAAAAGMGLTVGDSPETIRRAWPGAPLIIVGTDQASTVASLGLPARAGVHVAGTDPGSALAWSVPLGAPALVLPAQAGFLASLLDEAQRPGLALGAVLRLQGATGGLGTSTLAMGLAMRAARRGRRTAVIEMDATGGGLDVMAGLEREPGWRWGDLAAARGHLDDLTGRLPSVLGVDIVAASRASAAHRFDGTGPGGVPSVAPPEAVTAVLSSLRRTHDLVVVDQGRWPAPHEETVLVVGADVRAVLAAQAALAGGLTATRAVLRTGPGRRLAPDLVAESLGLTVVGVFRHDQRRAAGAEAGDPPGRASGATSRALDVLLDRLVRDRSDRPADPGRRRSALARLGGAA